MGFKEILNKMKERRDSKKEAFKNMQDQDKLSNLLEERKKSSNQRELEIYLKENQEKQIKEQLDIARKERSDEIRFNHNPLNTPNITNHVEWNVLKEKNMFSEKGNMFTNQEFMHKSNKNLLKSGNILKNKPIFKIQGGLNYQMAKKNKPKQDGSGRGVRANKGRSGCTETKKFGKGRR